MLKRNKLYVSNTQIVDVDGGKACETAQVYCVEFPAHFLKIKFPF